MFTPRLTATQRTPGFGVQLPGAVVVRPAQSRAVLPAMKPGTSRAFALRRRAHNRAPGPESLSLGSLGDATHLFQTNEALQHERYLTPSYPMPRLFPVCSESHASSPSRALLSTSAASSAP